MDFLEKAPKGKETYIAVDDLSLENSALMIDELRSYQTVNVPLPCGLADKFGLGLLFRSKTVESIEGFFMRSTVLDFIKTRVQGIVKDLFEGLLSESVAIDYLKQPCLFFKVITASLDPEMGMFDRLTEIVDFL